MTDFRTIAHFSQSNPSGRGQGNVAALLRRVAASIEELGVVEVQDIAFHSEVDDNGETWPHMTVYFTSSSPQPRLSTENDGLAEGSVADRSPRRLAVP